ncbi:hypothetical protein GCM10011297_20500 [Bacterioplanes sanyensis]|nr:hypothetical protein GCM10011297_20500 [Bacterioplanes sanyensis]
MVLKEKEWQVQPTALAKHKYHRCIDQFGKASSVGASKADYVRIGQQRCALGTLLQAARQTVVRKNQAPA